MEALSIVPLTIVSAILWESKAGGEVLAWVDGCLHSWESNMPGRVRCLGTGFHAFPALIELRAEKIDSILAVPPKELRLPPKRDLSACVTFLVPRIESTSAFASLSLEFCFEVMAPGRNRDASVAQASFVLYREQCLLGLAAIRQRSDQKLTQQITRAIAERLRRAEFSREIAMSSWMNFSESLDPLLAFVPIAPRLCFRAIIEYLGHLAKDMVNANFPRREVIDITAWFEALPTFLASNGILSLCSAVDRQEAIAVLLCFSETCTLLRTARPRPLILRILKSNRPQIVRVLWELAHTCAWFLTFFLDDDEFVGLLRPAMSKLTFDPNSEAHADAWQSPVTSHLGISFPRPLLGILVGVMKTYDNARLMFSPLQFCRLAAFLICANVDHFLAAALRAAEPGDPLLIANFLSVFTAHLSIA
jgi:hypothetical protein